MTEQALIAQYKRDFEQKIGKSIRITIVSRWEALCELPCKMEIQTVINLIFDATGWNYDAVFIKTRNGQCLFRRGLIYYILVSNRYSTLKIGKLTDKDHTTIINAYRRFEQQLNEEPLTSTILKEVMEYIESNYMMYMQGGSK